MSKEVLQKYASLSQENKKKCFALKGWCDRQGGNFKLQEVFDCLYDAAGGNMERLTSLIEQLTSKNKTFGRSSVVFGQNNGGMTIVRGEGGKLEIRGYNPNFTPNEKGQHATHSNEVIRGDGQLKKNVLNSREKLYNLGQEVRAIYQGQSNNFITNAMSAIKRYAKEHKISEMMVTDRLKKGVYTLDAENWEIKPKMKTIKLNESQLNELADATKLTEYKFYNNVQRFLSDLLRDPVGAKVPFLLQANNIARNQLLYHLKSNGIINRHQKISDKDSQGNPKTAKMIIKYSVPKKDFAKKMKKLFIALVAKNVPEKIEKMITEDSYQYSLLKDQLDLMKGSPLTMGVIGHPEYKQTDEYAELINNELKKDIDECDSGGAMGATAGNDSMGQFSQPLFGVQRRKMPVEIDETTTASNVTPNGDTSMGIAVPFTDGRTADRTPGFSVERQDESIDEYLDKRMSKIRNDFKTKNYDESSGFSWSDDAEDGKEIVHNEWMIHFSNDAPKISHEGFTQGNDYEGKLKSATYRRGKTEGGYNYAYLASDVIEHKYWSFLNYLKDRQTPFVMFKGNGYRFHHEQDGEEQVVLNNVQSGTKVLIMSLYDQWCVLSTTDPDWKDRKKDINPKPEDKRFAMNNTRNILDGVIYSDDDIDKVIKWVMTNFEQYRNKFKY